MRVVIAPDSFKGTLTSVEVARALADGWLRTRPSDHVQLCPLADGGEGTLVAIAAAGGWDWRTAIVADPIGRAITAQWLISTDGERAAIEMARASGLSLLGPAERDPIGATSVGTGELIHAALDARVTSIVLGIGGSATTDGGAGLLVGLGARADRDGPMVDLSGLDPRLRGVALEVACDVSNPLLGPDGAAAVYGPQKGATPAGVADLDHRLSAWAGAVETATGRRERETPGAGAAGGLGFALLAIAGSFRSFALRPGVDLVMEATDFDRRLATADLVITGEGRIDAQTAFGKTALGVARRARAADVRCIAVGGSVEPDGLDVMAGVGASAIPVWESPVPLDVALAAGADPLVACGERLARTMNVTGAQTSR